MKGAFKTLAAIAALIAAAPAPASSANSTQSIQKEQISQKVTTGTQYIKSMAGGFHVVSHDIGIPPHIYGQYHVRKGTHKKSNKRK